MVVRGLRGRQTIRVAVCPCTARPRAPRLRPRPSPGPAPPLTPRRGSSGPQPGLVRALTPPRPLSVHLLPRPGWVFAAEGSDLGGGGAGPGKDPASPERSPRGPAEAPRAPHQPPYPRRLHCPHPNLHPTGPPSPSAHQPLFHSRAPPPTQLHPQPNPFLLFLIIFTPSQAHSTEPPPLPSA